MRMSDFEQLAIIRERWPDFLRALHATSGQFAGGTVVHSTRHATPRCEPISLRDGTLTVAATHHQDESLVERDLGQTRADQWAAAFGEGTVTSLRIVSRDEAVPALAEELTALGVQVQRLLKMRKRSA